MTVSGFIDSLKYDVTVGIYRLTQMEGQGELDTISLTMTLKDPNGGDLYAEFYKRQDGTCTLIISESTWELLESGTEFNGFVKAE